MEVDCIIQARMSSSRLPGKVLMKIGDNTVLEFCVKRLQKVKTTCVTKGNNHNGSATESHSINNFLLLVKTNGLSAFFKESYDLRKIIILV